MQDFLRILKNFLLALNTPFFSYLSALPRSAQISEKSRKYKICRGYLPVLSVVPQPAFLPSFQMPAAPSSTPGSCCFPAGQSRAPSSLAVSSGFQLIGKTAVRKSSETDIPQMQQCSPRDAARRGFRGGQSIAPRAEVPQYPYVNRRLVEFLPPYYSSAPSQSFNSICFPKAEAYFCKTTSVGTLFPLSSRCQIRRQNSCNVRHLLLGHPLPLSLFHQLPDQLTGLLQRPFLNVFRISGQTLFPHFFFFFVIRSIIPKIVGH